MRTVSFDRDVALRDAMDVFWERGFAESSIEDLTSTTGLRRSSLYNTFTGKRELFLEALAAYHDRCSLQYDALATAEDPVDAIGQMVRAIVAGELDDSRGMGCLVANTALEFAGRDIEIRALTSKNLTAMSDAIASAVCRAQDAGRVDDALDTAAAARSIVTMIQGVRVTAKAMDPNIRAEWLAAAASSCLAILRS